jgi:HSP20 family molecular chaperone IbpA
MPWSTFQENRNTSIVRQIILRRIDSVFTIGLSPFERWSDDNYAPHPLEYVWDKTPDEYKLFAHLHGFGAQDVHVDLCRGHVIILLSRNYDLASVRQEEYYCEVPIPTGAQRNKALVEIKGDLLTIRLSRKKGNLFLRIASEIAHLGTDFGLPFGKVQHGRYLDDIESV